MDLIAETIAEIRPLDETAMSAARAHQDRLTKPRGALGVLEDLSVRLAGIAGACPPPMPEPAAVAVFAGDHGVHAQGVTPWPQEVTGQMVQNFLAGGAVVNAFARQVGADVRVVDVGMKTDLPAADGLLIRKTAHGTADMTREPAMTAAQVRAAVEAGITTARELVAAGYRCLITGDMGIANTTASAALIALFTGHAPEDVTGHGTGIDEQTHTRKIEVVRAALARARAELGSAPVGGAAPGLDGVPVALDRKGADPDGAVTIGEAAPGSHGTPAGQAPADPDSAASATDRARTGPQRTSASDGAPAWADPLAVLAQVGGFEHAAIAGFILGGAAERVPVVLDGVIAGAAALAAAALAPDVRDACVAGHRSAEPGHAAALRHLELRPLVDLELRLGEGTGALLALPLVRSAVRVLHEVATFDSAGVADKS
jgi:nicotinate-nucleotide--dimethylbenzimidazole phosphoribosyltransferase